MAAIEPAGERPGRRRADSAPRLALPKGLVDEGEKPAETAVREVKEETGVEAALITKLSDIRYVYVRTWDDGARVFKIVSFYLLAYRAGRVDELEPEMRQEVLRALWVPLEEAPRRLSYSGERNVAKLAQEYIAAHPEL